MDTNSECYIDFQFNFNPVTNWILIPVSFYLCSFKIDQIFLVILVCQEIFSFWLSGFKFCLDTLDRWRYKKAIMLFRFNLKVLMIAVITIDVGGWLVYFALHTHTPHCIVCIISMTMDLYIVGLDIPPI